MLAAALSAVSLVYAAQNLSISTDTAEMLSAKLPFRKTREVYKEAFPQYIDTLLLVVDARTPEGARAAASELAHELRQREDLFRSVYRPGAGAFFDQHALLYLDDDELQSLADELSRIQPFLGRLTGDPSLRGLLAMLSSALQAVREGESLDLEPMLARFDETLQAHLAGRDHRLSWQALILGTESSRAQNRQFVLAQPRLDYNRWLPGEPSVRAVRGLADKLSVDGTEDARVRLTGSVALSYEEMQSVTQGAGVAAVLAFVMVTVLLFIGLRSVRMLVASLLTLVAGLILAAGFAALAVGRLNMISVAFAVLYIGLGADFVIHLCLRLRSALQDGLTRAQAWDATARDVGPSLMLCALTTAVGFYAFVPTSYEGVAELGLIAGTGMLISLAASLTLLPALLSVAPLAVAEGGLAPLRQRVPQGLVTLPERHPSAVRRGALALALMGLVALPFVSFDANTLNLRPPQSESVSTFMDLVRTSETPPWNVTALVSDAATGARQAERLRHLDSVAKVVRLEDYVPKAQDAKLAVIDDMRFILGPQLAPLDRAQPPTAAEQMTALTQFDAELGRYLAATPALAWQETVTRLRTDVERLLASLRSQTPAQRKAALAALEQSLLGYLPGALERLRTAFEATPVTLETLPSTLTRRWVSPEGLRRIEVFPHADLRDDAALTRFVEQVRGVTTDITGLPAINVAAGQAVVTAFQEAFAGALVVIALALLAIMRSLVSMSLVLTPLLLAGVLTGAASVVLGIPFNFANIIALPLLLGIGVDSAIHIVQRARRAPGEQVNILRTSTARAVYYSALTTIFSFGNLGFSPHPGTASLGQMLTIGVVLTLISTLIVLPAMLARRQAEASSR